ncbi:MAG TPA: hypothetical protein VNO70_01090 [Blastocatellia bacterium]|nr:hypothetical protein [Blastocatellia bacterium]
MDLFGLTADSVAARVSSAPAEARIPTLGQSIWRGSVAFCFASLLVFATVAFGERWMYRQFGLYGAYAIWTLLFVLVGGGALSPLIIGPGRLARFYLLFSAAFLLYAAGWVAAYFAMPNKAGEWLGSLAGSILMGLTLAVAFGAVGAAWKIVPVLFLLHSAGYFAGDFLYKAVGGRLGMMLWGVCYGLGVGAGLGYALYVAQAPVRARLNAWSAKA